MFIFLYGEDTYRSSQKLREIVNEYKKVHKTGLNLIYFDCANSNFEEFKNSVQSISMFQEKKLIILKQSFFNTNFKEKFLQWARQSSLRGASPTGRSDAAISAENIIMVYENQPVKKTDALFKFLKTKAKTQEFNSLARAKLEDWIDKEFQKYGAKIEFSARAKLIIFVGSDLWQMSQEIKKLCAYALPSSSVILRSELSRASDEESPGIPVGTVSRTKQRDSSLRPVGLVQNDNDGGDAAISVHDVQLLVVPKIETDIFKTIDAIALKNKSSALLLLHKHLAKGDAPLYLLSMINFQFRNLLVVKDYLTRPASSSSLRGSQQATAAISTGYNAIKIPGMHPYVVQKSIAQARNFTFDKLKKIYYKLLAIDAEIKTGKVDARMALDMLVIGI